MTIPHHSFGGAILYHRSDQRQYALLMSPTIYEIAKKYYRSTIVQISIARAPIT